MLTVIVDYSSGNLHSAEKSVRRMADELCCGEVRVSSRPETVAGADRLILPGVGAFADCRHALAKRGLDEAIRMAVVERAVPFLGICVGMQLMATTGLEHGRTNGFDWIPGVVRSIERGDAGLKIPHMGWNSLRFTDAHPLFAGICETTDVYFVHSYHLVPAQAQDRIAFTDYGGDVTAAVAAGNLAGVQFHPEKSQRAGLRIIANFLSWDPG